MNEIEEVWERGAAALFAVGVLAFFGIVGLWWPGSIPVLAEEDHCVEWLGTGAFFAAGFLYSRRAWGRPLRESWFDAALALGCLFIAGEDISWGQRLLMIVPPKSFLTANYQQEFNLHNLFNAYLNVKWLPAWLLGGWGMLLPALGALPKAGASLRGWGLRSPGLSVLPWSAAGVFLTAVYPLPMTGEYVELLAGALFFQDAMAVAPLTRGALRAALVAPAAIALLGFGLTDATARWHRAEKSACAEAEVRAMAKALADGAALAKVGSKSSVHKRAWTAVEDGYLSPAFVKSLDAVVCEGVARNPDRRAYLIDPWGDAYWVRFHREEDGSYRAAVYSFGFDRRRGSAESGGFEGTGDIGAWTPLPALPDDTEDGEDDEGGIGLG